MLYPHPTIIPYYGDTERALTLLRQVTLEDTRYICHDIRYATYRAEALASEALDKDIKRYHTGASLCDWIEHQMEDKGTCSYDAWLIQLGYAKEGDLEVGTATNQPEKLKASRLAWVADMIAYLEKQE